MKFYLFKVILLPLVLTVYCAGYSFAIRSDSLVNVAMQYTKDGGNYLAEKDYQQAVFYFKQSVLIWDQVEEYNVYKANPFFQLAGVYRLLGDYQKCIEYYILAEKILIKAPEIYSYLLGGLYSNLGYVYTIYGDYQKALTYYNRAINILVSSRNKYVKSYSYAVYGKAEVLYYQQEYEEAISISKNYLLHSHYKELLFIRLIGNCQIKIKLFDEAIKNLEDVATRFANDSVQRSQSLLILSKAYFCNDELSKTEQCLLEAIPILQKTRAENDPWMVYYYEIYGQLLIAKAEQNCSEIQQMAFYNEAIDILDKALLLNSNDKEIPYLEGDGDFIIPTQVKDVLVSRTRALKGMGQIYEKANDKFATLNLYDRALKNADATINFLHDFRISFLEEESKLELSENYTDVYFDGFCIAADLFEKTGHEKYFDRMLYFSESGKSATLLASLNDVAAKHFGGIPDSLVQQERDMQKQLSNLKQLIFNEKSQPVSDTVLISEWEKIIFTLQNEHDEMIFLFEREYPDYYDFKYKNSTIATKEITDNLQKHQALIEYYIDEPDSSTDTGAIYCMVFTTNGHHLYRQQLNYQYIVDLETLYGQLTNKNIGNTNIDDFRKYTKAANRLYQTLIAPLELDSAIEDLIIVPHGRLAYIPFDALLSEEVKVDKLDYRSLSYLVKKYNITYSYSATLHFKYFKSNKRSGQNILAMAPSYDFLEYDLNKEAYRHRQVDRAILRPLPGAKEEVVRLSEFHHCKAFLDQNATEENFKKYAGDFDILHLAMHTIINDSIPMFSKLVFAQSNDTIEDGFLNTQEIYNMKLNSRLAVLSACNTGSGVMRKGEGVMSMSRAFLYAGCPSIVMTLWEVEDKMSANLMMDFYRFLFKGCSKPEALRKAKLLHIQNADPLKAHPYFWLGYIFVGDPSPIKYNNNVMISILIFSSIVFVLVVSLFRFFNKKKPVKAESKK